MMDLSHKKCIPCEVGGKPLDKEGIAIFVRDLPGWEVVDDIKLRKVFSFKDFVASMKFVNAVADIAEEQGHHPDIHIYYDSVTIELTTHAVGGLTENDFIVAAKIGKI